MVSIVGGAKLQAKLAEMAGKLGPGKSLRVGFLENSTCGVDMKSPAPAVAFFNEFGTVERANTLENIEPLGQGPLQKGHKRASHYFHIPARPFFRNMIAKYHKSWGKLIEAALKKQNYGLYGALAITGEVMRGQLQKSIEEFTDPRNAPATVKAKGFDKPLEESKNMKNAVAYAVTGFDEEAGNVEPA